MSSRVALSKGGEAERDWTRVRGHWTKNVGDLNSSRDCGEEVVEMEGVWPGKGVVSVAVQLLNRPGQVALHCRRTQRGTCMET